MYRIERTDSDNPHFRHLVTFLDADLRIRDGDDHPFFAQFNKIDSIKYVVVAFAHEEAVGCGAIKNYDDDTMEVKRMFVVSDYRNKGVASLLLKELEDWTVELGFGKCILETGRKQFEAVGLYRKNGYTLIPNYGQYKDVVSSVCFEKVLSKNLMK